MLPLCTKLLPKPQGLRNIGANCYFNALIQCLFSCTSVLETLNAVKDEPFVTKNRLALGLIETWNSHVEGTANDSTVLNIYRDMLDIASRQNSTVRMNSGQQDSHEGLMMIFTAMESIPHFQRLFNNRYLCTVVCSECKKEVVNHKDVSSYVDIPEDFDGTTLNSYLLTRETEIEDYQCTCGYKGTQRMKLTLTRVPNVLCILLKKYDKKTEIDLPQSMTFPGIGGKSLQYALVSCCEHSGSRGGGHYWATARRHDGDYELNDSLYTPSVVKPTAATYIAFYHFTIN